MTLPLMSILGNNCRQLIKAAKDPEVSEENLFAKKSLLYINKNAIRIKDFATAYFPPLVGLVVLRDYLSGYYYDMGEYSNAMRKTEYLFFLYCPKIMCQCKNFGEYIVRSCRGGSESAYPFRRVKQDLIDWHQSGGKLIAKLHGKRGDALFKLLAKEFKANLKETFPIGSANYIKAVETPKRFFYLITLEGALKSPLPYKILYKAAMSIKLDARDRTGLSRWCSKVRKQGIEVRLFHRAMASLAGFIKQEMARPEDHPSVEQLEDMLYQYGLDDLLLSEDKQQLEWRENLGPGSRIWYKGTPLTIKRQIGAKENQKADKTFVFEVQENSAIVLQAAVNEAIPALKKLWGTKYAFGTMMQEIRGFDGGIAVVQKLKEPFKSHKWTTSGKEISRQDRDLVTPLVNSIKWLASEKRPTPLGLSIQNFMFDSEDKLRCLKITPAGDRYDMDALEEFAWQASLGNEHIFRHIMNESGLLATKQAKFYREVVKAALSKKKPDLRLIAATYSIESEKIMKRSRQLVDEVKKNHAAKREAMRRKAPLTDASTLAEAAGKQILKAYQEKGCAGRLRYN